MGHKKNKYFKSSKNEPKIDEESSKKKKNQPWQPRIQTDEQLIDQVLQVEQLLSRSRDKLNKTEQHCYLLSTAWLRSWKMYTGYDVFLKQQNPIQSQNFGKCRPEKINTDIIGKQQTEYVELPKSLEQYNYLNISIDPSVQLNKDFMLIDADLWYYFESKYTGHKILRPISHRKGKATRFDVDLTDIRFVALPDEAILHLQEIDEETFKNNYEQLLPIYKLQVPSFWTMTDLRQFAAKYLKATMNFEGNPADIDFWKFENYISERDIKVSMISTIRKKKFNFLGRILKDEEQKQYEISDFMKSSYVLYIKFGQTNFNQVNSRPVPFTGNCQACLAKHSLQVSCVCKRVYYCGKKCCAEDKSFHQRTCDFAYDSDDDEEYMHKSEEIVNSKCGFINLGNTCYMNAALQCLMSVVPFVSYFVRNLYLSVIDKKELELNRGVFIKKFTKMLKKYQEYEVLSPWGLKTQVNHFMRSFRGYDQHDSSQFLMALLNTVNDFLEKDNKQHGYSRIITETFLGWFQSKIVCPECGYQTNNHEPFLSVSLPIKSKTVAQQYSYVVVQQWNHYRKGYVPIGLDWNVTFKEIGIKTGMRRLIGVEGSELLPVSEESTLLQLATKHPKQSVVFYKSNPIGQGEVQIQVNLAYMHNQAKTHYGYPIFLRMNMNRSLYEVYLELVEIVGINEEVRHQLEQFILQTTQKFEQLNNDKAVNRQDQSIIQEFEDRFTKKLGFETLIVNHRKTKKACAYCHRKCAWCVLPFSFTNRVEQYVAISQKAFGLELVFAQKVELRMQQKPSLIGKDNDMITLQECIAQFSEPQILDEDNFWFCTVCQAPRQATKIMSISKLPNILVLHLKRFKQQGGHKVKNNDPVRYPQSFELDGQSYRFNSAIVHEGSLEGGHYWAICRKDNAYYIFNDDTYKQIESIFNRNAYILFYERI